MVKEVAYLGADHGRWDGPHKRRSSGLVAYRGVDIDLGPSLRLR